MVRLACGHRVAVRAHLSGGASLVAAACPVCRSSRPIPVAGPARASRIGAGLRAAAWLRALLHTS